MTHYIDEWQTSFSTRHKKIKKMVK